MAANSITLDQEVSIFQMLSLQDLDDSETTFIYRFDSVWRYRDILLRQLVNVRKDDVRIYLRPFLITGTLEPYLTYARQGAAFTLWKNDTALGAKDRANVTIVQSEQNNGTKQEGFLVVQTPYSSRMLAAWKDKDNIVTGILTANKATVDKIADYLENVIQSGR